MYHRGARERPGMRRDWLGGSLVLLITLVAFGGHAVGQVGFDRPGGDYASFALRSGDPAQCAARCERDTRCQAWAFSYPLTESTSAVCWLKNKVTPRVAATCCVSGVRGTGVIEPRDGLIEFGIDRFGGDYRRFDAPTDTNGKACQLACEDEEACRVWTYVRPGYVGNSAVCYLKNHITRPVHKPCCISGVVR
jgi:PAN domain